MVNNADKTADSQARALIGVLLWRQPQVKFMTFESRTSGRPFLVGFNTGEPIAEQRARIAREQAEREEHRQAELVELSSIRNGPGNRIRLWERMHGLTLPRDPNHPILDVIAAATDLELSQVQEEQRQRHPAS
jgi:hypothetical protein